MSAKVIFSLALLAMAGAMPASGEDPREAAMRQEEIEMDARKLDERLDNILDGYRRNKLEDAGDFKAVQKLRTALGALSDEEMRQVVAMLREAGALQNPVEALRKMTAACQEEKDISRKLKQLVATFRRAKEKEGLAHELAQLAARQTENLKAASELAALNARNGNTQATASAASVGAQHAEESAIAAAAQEMAGQMALASATDRQLAAASAALKALAPTATAAEQALAANQMDQAVAAETQMDEKLRQIAQSIPAADGDPQDNATGQIANLLKEQQELAAQTTALDESAGHSANPQAPDARLEKAIRAELQKPGSPLAEHLAQEGLSPDSPLEQLETSPEVRQFAESQAASLKKAQADVPAQAAALAAAQTDLAAQTRGLLHTQNEPGVHVALNAALAQMQAAQGELARTDASTALTEQNAAASELAAAQEAAQNAAGKNAAGAHSPGAPGEKQAQGNQPGPQNGQRAARGGKSDGANEHSWKDGAGTLTAEHRAVPGTAEFAGLPERDRAAIRQSQAEKYPAEYGTMVEQYMQDLAQDTKTP